MIYQRGEEKLWTERLLSQSLENLLEGGEHVYTGWTNAPVWYLIYLKDCGLPMEAA